MSRPPISRPRSKPREEATRPNTCGVYALAQLVGVSTREMERVFTGIRDPKHRTALHRIAKAGMSTVDMALALEEFHLRFLWSATTQSASSPWIGSGGDGKIQRFMVAPIPGFYGSDEEREFAMVGDLWRHCYERRWVAVVKHEKGGLHGVSWHPENGYQDSNDRDCKTRYVSKPSHMNRRLRWFAIVGAEEPQKGDVAANGWSFGPKDPEIFGPQPAKSSVVGGSLWRA